MNVNHWKGIGLTLTLPIYLAITFAIANSNLSVQGLVLNTAIFAILAVSLDLVAGILGLYSLAHAGLFAVGAYINALLSSKLGINVFVLLPLCILVTSLIGIILGAVSLRIGGLYFAITTLVFTMVVSVLITDLQITGGTEGVVGPLFPEFPTIIQWLGASYVWCVMLLLLAIVVLVWNIRKSPLKPVLLAIRDAESFAEASGVRTSLIKVSFFGLSAAMAGLAGWLFPFLGVVSPGQFNWAVSLNILVMVLLGGINTTWGPLIGAAFVSMFPDLVNINPWLQEIMYGGICIVVITLFPEGVVGLLKRALGTMGSWLPSFDSAYQAFREREIDSDTFDLSVSGDRSVVVGATWEELKRAVIKPYKGSSENDVAVECVGIDFQYKAGPKVLHNVDLVVLRGQIHGLIGPNGSGKSTLANIIAGYLKPLSGTIKMKGEVVDRLPPYKRADFGLRRSFQSAELVRELTNRENVLIGLYSRVPGIVRRAPFGPMLPSGPREMHWMQNRADGVLDAVGAANWSSQLSRDAPHGVEQLTQLASVCVAAPDVVILDEPATGLSPSEVENLAYILSELKDLGVTMIIIEHQTRFLFPLCDVVSVLNAGEVIASSTPDSVRTDPLVRKVYLGE